MSSSRVAVSTHINPFLCNRNDWNKTSLHIQWQLIPIELIDVISDIFEVCCNIATKMTEQKEWNKCYKNHDCNLQNTKKVVCTKYLCEEKSIIKCFLWEECWSTSWTLKIRIPKTPIVYSGHTNTATSFASENLFAKLKSEVNCFMLKESSFLDH